MTVPSKADLNKREKKRKDLWKGLNPDGSMTEKQLCTQIRSALRMVWMRHKTKLTLLYDNTIPDMNPATRTKWLITCNCCKKKFKLSDVEVNHIHGENSLQTIEDILPFAISILGVNHKDLEILCKECHSIFTYSQRYNVSIEEAKAEKAVGAKLKQSVTKQKAELSKAGYTSKDISNADKRRSCYRELLIKNNSN